MTTPYAVVALPADLAAQLPPIRVAFVLVPGPTGLDMRTVTASRCRIEKPDHSFLDWALTIEGAAPAPALTAVTVYHMTAPSDFADANALPLGGTWEARFFATFSGGVGELCLGIQTFVVEQVL